VPFFAPAVVDGLAASLAGAFLPAVVPAPAFLAGAALAGAAFAGAFLAAAVLLGAAPLLSDAVADRVADFFVGFFVVEAVFGADFVDVAALVTLLAFFAELELPEEFTPAAVLAMVVFRGAAAATDRET
jgi:hypothetical protein